ncbi:MAG: phosphatidylglycerophosphatase A [Verrucomicrobia bacterium]|nr:phosphatidylglycerophosphatase A [Verrucomicrobiota bacterium]
MRGLSPAVILATVFGVGSLRGAPGTYGAVVGAAVAALLRWMEPSVAIEAAVLTALILGAVFVTDRACKRLGRPDPPQIVLDELVTMPVALFLVPLVWHWYVLGFALHRALDILKPPPIRQLQRLPGGWGIVADDVAAAVLTNVILQVVIALSA